MPPGLKGGTIALVNLTLRKMKTENERRAYLLWLFLNRVTQAEMPISAWREYMQAERFFASLSASLPKCSAPWKN